MRRTRRKSQGTWLPLLGTSPAGDDAELRSSANTYVTLAIPQDGTPILAIFPLTFDYPLEGASGLGLTPGLDSLSDIVGSEYILKRVLGTLFACNVSRYNSPTQDSLYYEAHQLTAGFFVARAGSNEQLPLGPTAPISYGATGGGAADAENYSPENPATQREPWMWKRTWILGNERRYAAMSTAAGILTLGHSVYPAANSGYGDMRSGPQVDIKSRRRVCSDERLFVALSARGLPFDQDRGGGGDEFLDVVVAVRMFGQLVKAKQTGAF